MALRTDFELDDRRYLREKVVATYEKMWRGDELSPNDWSELLCLKVNAGWLQSAVGRAPAEQLVLRRPVVRQLFKECCAKICAEGEDASVVSHALETLSGVLLGLGDRRAAQLALIAAAACP